MKEHHMVDVFYYMALFMVDDMMASKCPKPTQTLKTSLVVDSISHIMYRLTNDEITKTEAIYLCIDDADTIKPLIDNLYHTNMYAYI